MKQAMICTGRGCFQNNAASEKTGSHDSQLGSNGSTHLAGKLGGHLVYKAHTHTHVIESSWFAKPGHDSDSQHQRRCTRVRARTAAYLSRYDSRKGRE